MRRFILLALVALLLVPATATAEPLGPFRWRLESEASTHCELWTLTLIPVGQTYKIPGTTDSCGATYVARPVFGA